MSQSAPTMIRPHQIDQLPILDAATKQQYKTGLQSLWEAYENNPEGSEKKQQAADKIKTASNKLMTQLAQARNRPVSGGGPRPNQPQQGNMGGMQAQQQMTPQQMAQAQAQAQARAQAAQGGQPNQQQRPQLSPQAQAELENVSLVKPANISPQQLESWKASWRKEAFTMLARRDAILAKARQLNAHIKQAKDNGQEPSSEAVKQFEEARKALEVSNTRWKQWKAQGEGTAAPSQQQPQQQQTPQQQQNQQRPGTQGGVSNPAAQQQQPQQQQQVPQDAKPANADQQGTSISPSQPQAGFQQTPQQNAPAQQPKQSAQQNMPQQGQPAQPQLNQTPQSASMPQVPQNFPQQNIQQHQQQRPQINTQISNPNQMGGQQNAPNPNMPNAAGQVNPQRPQPLNHAQAMSQAAANYSQTSQQQQQQPPMPNGLPFNSNQPNSATQQNTPTSQYPNLQTTQTSSVNTRFPIPKTLALDPRTQTAVAGPPSRPTLGYQGAMTTPGVMRAPPYVLEGEGDRVLSKRKLDELVRQVTGAAPSSDNSETSSVLTPEVEESILQVADNFVDDVITSACRLAKLRPNQTLDIRDIQMALERNYGIRIPGYSLDEVRTVRKFQPAPGWTNKMQAVQAGKVMGSRDA